MWDWNAYHMGCGSMGLAMIGMPVFWIVIIAVVVTPLCSRGSGNSESARTALQLLNERYARGEIGKEEFEFERRDLAG